MDDMERAAGLGLTGLDDGQRWAARTHRASELAAQLCHIQADLVAFTTELLTSEGWAGDGVRSPEHWLQVYTGLGLTHARELVRVAERAGELAPVMDRMRLGAVTLDQAAVIARHVPTHLPVEVVEQVDHLAEAVTTTQLSRVVAHHQFDRTILPRAMRTTHLVCEVRALRNPAALADWRDRTSTRRSLVRHGTTLHRGSARALHRGISPHPAPRENRPRAQPRAPRRGWSPRSVPPRPVRSPAAPR